MINPCRNCDKRTCPKMCEKDCKKWNEYKFDHDKQIEKIQQIKIIERLLWKHS